MFLNELHQNLSPFPVSPAPTAGYVSVSVFCQQAQATALPVTSHPTDGIHPGNTPMPPYENPGAAPDICSGVDTESDALQFIEHTPYVALVCGDIVVADLYSLVTTGSEDGSEDGTESSCLRWTCRESR